MSVFDDYRRATWTPYEDISPEQTELATELRVPFLNSPHPRWYYITGVVVSDLYRAVPPTDDEVRMIASFADEYRRHWLNESFIAVMAELAPYDIDGGAVGRFLRKRPDGGWCYRRSTWQYGPFWVPKDDEPASLVSVLDRIQTIGKDGPMPRWVQWKADHPEAFGAAVPPTTGEGEPS